eukprot:TRINITY_DN78876_c0_g1_i1.p1 TRINITY_DN78876_c0_g1~~TRINITY_DN78876_c0_g1_i1.p1  ORF type:complete len:212 (-),score=53.34 TRINITY_DN78876_c0_g1_i1:57-692(-)
MFDLDDLEAVDPSSNELTFTIGNEELFMRLPDCKGATAQDVIQIWEREWGVTYANRLRFLAVAPGSGNGFRSLNPRQDTLPPMVKLEGPGSVLTAVAVGLRQRRGGPTPAPGISAAAASKPAANSKAALPKKAGLGPVQREAFRRHQAEMRQQYVLEQAEDPDAPLQDDSWRREREGFLRDLDARRKEEEDRWAREEATWAANRRNRTGMN